MQTQRSISRSLRLPKVACARGELAVVVAGEHAVTPQQLGQAALFHDPAALQHEDVVAAPHGRQPMGDDAGGAAPSDARSRP